MLLMENTTYIYKQYSENDKSNKLKVVILTTCITFDETKVSTWWPSCFGGKVESFILTHWGRVTHICVNKLSILGSHNGLSPGRRQAII